MKIYVDEESKIKAVGSSDNPDLIEIEINDDGNPFADWSSAKICCYQVAVSDGVVIMYTPYVASSALDYIDHVGKENDLLVDKATAADILMGLVEVEE